MCEKSGSVHEIQLDAAVSDKPLSLQNLPFAKAARQKRAIEEDVGKELDPKRVCSDNWVLQPKVFQVQESSMLQSGNSPQDLLAEDLHDFSTVMCVRSTVACCTVLTVSPKDHAVSTQWQSWEEGGLQEWKGGSMSKHPTCVPSSARRFPPLVALATSCNWDSSPRSQAGRGHRAHEDCPLRHRQPCHVTVLIHIDSH